jgi:hypothetical protein
MATYRLAGLRTSSTGIKYRLSHIRASAGGVKYRFAKLRATSGDYLAVTLGPTNPPTVDPFTRVALTASSVLPADSWTFAQLSGPLVTMTGTGGSRTFKAPARLTASVLLFQVTATKAGYPNSVAQVTHTVAPHAGLYAPDGRGIEIRGVAGALWPDTGLFPDTGLTLRI